MDPLLATSFLITLLAFTAIWLIHGPLGDAGIVDFYWGPGFAVIGWSGLWLSGEVSGAKLLLVSAVTLWAVLLSAQLVLRHRLMGGEDARYARMRAAAGRSWWWTSLFKVFLLQAVILWAVATPVHALVLAPVAADLSPWGWLGLAAFLAGLGIETVADWQLYRHRRSRPPKGETLKSGLWALSRHPNYVGEILLWFGIGLASADVSGAWWALAGPVLLALVIRFVSLPLTEAHLAASRADYAAYAAKTPVLVPLPRLARPGAGPSGRA